jgi:hypothetical protein
MVHRRRKESNTKVGLLCDSKGSGDYDPFYQMPWRMHLCLKMAKKSVDEESTANIVLSTSSIGPQNVFPL